MKSILLNLFCIISICSFCQDKKEYLLSGQIMSHDSVSLENAYLINYRTYNVYATNKHGKFNIPVEPGDSLVITYISYSRKIIYADSVALHPMVYLELDTFFLQEICVFQNKVDEIENMRKNLKSIDYSQLPMPTEAYTEQERIAEFITANNNILRAEAGLLKIYKFSPSAVIGSLFKKKKNRKNSKKITSTRKKR